MPCQMVQDTVKIIESPLMGAGGHGHMALASAAYTPFANGGSIIPGITHHGTQRMGIFNRLVLNWCFSPRGIPWCTPSSRRRAPERKPERRNNDGAAESPPEPERTGQES